MNYTKGEWKREYPNDQLIAVLEMDNEAGYETWKYIAEINPCGDMRFTDEEYEANANLIKASPKMYEALKYAFNALTGGRNVGLSDWAIKMQQALAKAEGKEEK